MEERRYQQPQEVADRAGIKLTTLRGKATRKLMPAPTDCPTCGCRGVFAIPAIDAWLERRAARKALRENNQGKS